MKRVFLSLILSVLMLGSSIVFASCKKDTFKLKNMNQTYVSAIEKLENVKIDEKGLEFIYNKNKENFQNEINKADNYPYTNIKTFYTPLINYSTSFINNYISKCSSNEITVKKQQRKEIEIALNNYIASIEEVNNQISNVAVMVNINPASPSTHLKLQDLFSSYENLCQSAFTFSDYLQEMYFDYVADYNTNPSLETINNFDINKHAILLNAKLANTKVELAEVYIEKNVKDKNYPEKLVQKTEGVFNMVDASFNSFNTLAKSIDKGNMNIASIVSAINQDSTMKQNFYNQSIILYNIEQALNDNKPMFDKSKASIDYKTELVNKNITPLNKIHLKAIDDYELIINKYAEAFAQTLIYIGE